MRHFLMNREYSCTFRISKQYKGIKKLTKWNLKNTDNTQLKVPLITPKDRWLLIYVF